MAWCPRRPHRPSDPCRRERPPRASGCRPASSAGVERMFSQAGKLYDDEKKGQEGQSLEHTLFASANTE